MYIHVNKIFNSQKSDCEIKVTLVIQVRTSERVMCLLGNHLENVVLEFCAHFILGDAVAPLVAVVLQVVPR